MKNPDIKPKIKIERKVQKIYPKIELSPAGSMYPSDRLTLEFKEDAVYIHAYIDGTGNTFLLPYEAIKGVCR